MLEKDVAAIRAKVRAIAANKLVDRKAIADLLCRITIVPSDIPPRGIKAFGASQPFVGALFGRRFDDMISSELRNLFPERLKHITDQLEASSRAEPCATQGNVTGTATQGTIPDPSTRKKTRVEECFVLDVEQMEKWGILWPKSPSFGFMVLFKTLTGAPLLCTWETYRSESSSRIGLTYLVPGSDEVMTSTTIGIWRSKRSQKTGTGHAWLKCPHEDASIQLGQSRRWYLPPGAERFGSNQCYDLDYHRSQSMAGLDLSVPFFFQFPLKPSARKYALRRRTLG